MLNTLSVCAKFNRSKGRSRASRTQKKVTLKGGDMDTIESSRDEMKKGPWSEAEDEVLREFVKKHKEGNWNIIRKETGLKRSGKSCRMRWFNHLRPNLKKGRFTPEEEQTVIDLHSRFGNKWALMALKLPGRTDNEIKNFWNTRAKKLNKLGLVADHPRVAQPITPSVSVASTAPLFPTGMSNFSSLSVSPSLSSFSNGIPFMTYPLSLGMKDATFSTQNDPFSLTNILQSPFFNNQPNKHVNFDAFGQQLQLNQYVSSSTLSFSPAFTQQIAPIDINVSNSIFNTASHVQSGVGDTNLDFTSFPMNNFFHLQNPNFSSNAGTSHDGTIQFMQTPQSQNPFSSSNIDYNHGALMESIQIPKNQNFHMSSNIGYGSNSHGGMMDLTNNDAITYVTPQIEEFNGMLGSTDFMVDCSLNYDPAKGSITFSQQAIIDKEKRKIDGNFSSSWVDTEMNKGDMNMSHYSKDSKVIMEDWDNINSLDDNLPNLLDEFFSPTPPYSSLDAIVDNFALNDTKRGDGNVRLGQKGKQLSGE